MKKISLLLLVSLFHIGFALAYDDAELAMHNPNTGSYCDIQTDFPEFKGYDGWCRLGEVSTPMNCQEEAKAFAKAMDENLDWQFVAVRSTTPLSIEIGYLFEVGVTEGDTEAAMGEYEGSRQYRYENLGALSIDRRLPCSSADDFASAEF